MVGWLARCGRLTVTGFVLVRFVDWLARLCVAVAWLVGGLVGVVVVCSILRQQFWSQLGVCWLQIVSLLWWNAASELFSVSWNCLYFH